MPTLDDDLLLPSPEYDVTPETLAEIQRLYHEAFRLYGSIALWNLREHAEPTAADAMAITKALRTHGRMPGRRHAERIEALCRATD